MNSDRDAPELSVEHAPSLTTQLDALTVALDGSGADLNTILGVLVQDLTMAVGSFVGMCITVPADGEPITLIAMNSHTAATSMMLPLIPVAGMPASGHIVLYAQTPGAFVDLAADTRIAYDLTDEIVLDGHLPPPTASAAKDSADLLSHRSSVNQAVGYLIEAGHPPAQAQAELKQLAADAGVSLQHMARQLLDPDPESDPRHDDDRGDQPG